MDNRTLSTSSVTMEDIKESMTKLEPLKEVFLVTDDNEYIGNINGFGELTLNCNITDDTFNKLFKKVQSDNICVGIDYGNGIDETNVMECTLNRKITNVHRVRKGKRYIIKFDYTGFLNLIGRR